MSDAVSYVSEPGTVGKVLVRTTVGDLDIELFSVQTPQACRNFVQHALDGYFNGCLFHRVIKGFMAQTGDPTGTGEGGDSAFNGGGEFADEFHSRLRFTRRGLIGMASNGKNSNRSQWFVTLGAAEFLNNKHTLFGKLTGDTLFNILKFDELDVENVGGVDGETGRDRPFNPPRVISTEVLVNPFDDLKARVKEAPKVDTRPKKKQKKNLTLLSFGEEEEVEEVALAAVAAKVGSSGGQSSHDLAGDARLSRRTVDEELAEQQRLDEDARRSSETKGEAARDEERQSVRDALVKKKPSTSSAAVVEEEYMDEAAFDAHMRSKLLQKKGLGSSSSSRIADAAPATKESKVADEAEDPLAARKKHTDEYVALKAEMGLSGGAASKGPASIKSSAVRVTTTPGVDDALLSPLEQRRSKFKTRKQNATLASREADTLAKLEAFKASVSKAREAAAPIAPVEVTPLYSLVAIPPVPVRQDDEDADWLGHQVKFQRRPQDFDRMARDVENLDYAVQDPRGEEGSRTISGSFASKGGGRGGRTGGGDRDRDRRAPAISGHRGMSGVSTAGAEERMRAPQQIDQDDENARVVERLLREADTPSAAGRKRSRSRTPEP